MEKIFVTRSFLPPVEEFRALMEEIYARNILTNQGPMLRELERLLRGRLGAEHLHYVSNGTVALQIALHALGVDGGEIITTPFSYVATVSSILWQRCTPVFVDVEPGNFTIDAERIEEKITENTRAILPVHVFGYACDVEKIDVLARRHDLKVIYDGAHAFLSRYKGRSLLSYGDITTCSFHATKLFHTIEGGACIVRDAETSRRLDLIKRFGHDGDDHFCLGINAKQSEIHAAMGIANLKHIDAIVAERKTLCETYTRLLEGAVRLPAPQRDLEYNYAYYPVVFEDEARLLAVFDRLRREDIYPRRYFYPSLNTLPYLARRQSCPVSEDIARRIACLPLFVGMEDAVLEKVALAVRA